MKKSTMGAGGPWPMMEMVYNVRPARGIITNRTLLSCRSDGTLVDLWSADDESGRQKWVFKQIEGSIYNIFAFGGTNERRLLSCNSDGSVVDLWSMDDNSGRQKWRLEPIGGNVFHIFVAGGVWGERRYLSCTQTGDKVDLYTMDDNSGRQQWELFPTRL